MSEFGLCIIYNIIKSLKLWKLRMEVIVNIQVHFINHIYSKNKKLYQLHIVLVSNIDKQIPLHILLSGEHQKWGVSG